MGYRNPKPLITFEPHLLVDQKNQKSFFQGGDVVFANGQTIPVPGGFDLPTTGLWHQLLDIPQVSGVPCRPKYNLQTVFGNELVPGPMALPMPTTAPDHCMDPLPIYLILLALDTVMRLCGLSEEL